MLRYLSTGQLVQDFSHQYFKVLATFAGPIRFVFREKKYSWHSLAYVVPTKKRRLRHFTSQNCIFIIASDEVEVKSLDLNINLSTVSIKRVLPLYFPRVGVL